jgi:hypothetical protein
MLELKTSSISNYGYGQRQEVADYKTTVEKANVFLKNIEYTY